MSAKSIVLVLLAVMLCAPLAAQNEVADRLWAAADTDGALKEYEKVLSKDPANVHALIRSAQVLSWSKQYPEAVARYDRALKINPKEPTARMERAKVLSWAGKYSEAADGFRSVLAADPQNRDARLGLARTLSWSGRQADARKEYERVLDMKSNDADALLGVAQTFAWSSQQADAREWYVKALAADPESRAARIGLAYIDLEQAKRGAAAKTAEDLAGRYPKDTDVVELKRAVRRATSPSAEAGFDAISDSDSNDLHISRIRGSIPLKFPAELSVTAARYDMESGSQSGKISSAGAQISMRPAGKHRIFLRAGVDRLQSQNTDRDEFVGTASYSWGDDAKELTFTADRDSFKYSVPILDNAIVVESYGGRFAKTSNRWRLNAGVAYGDFSDGNRRINGDAGLFLRRSLRGARFEFGYVYRYLDLEQSLSHGYFDPQDFGSHALQLRVSGQFGGSRVEYGLAVEGGVQSFLFRGVQTNGDQFGSGTATLGFPLFGALRLELFANKSTSALNSATGFESEQFGALLRVQR